MKAYRRQALGKGYPRAKPKPPGQLYPGISGLRKKPLSGKNGKRRNIVLN